MTFSPSSPLWYVSLFINLTWWVECCQHLGAHLILPLHSNTLTNMFQTVKEMYTSKSEMSQFSQPWWFHKAFAINGGWWSPGFVRARIGICSKISLSTHSLNCWTGVWNKSRTIIWSTQLFRLSPSLRSMHRPALLVYCQFHLNTTLHRETTLRTALELLDTVFTTRFEANCRE